MTGKENKKLIAASSLVENKLPANIILRDRVLFDRHLFKTLKSIYSYSLKNVNLVDKGVVFKHLNIIYELLLANDNNYIAPYNVRDLLRIYWHWDSKQLCSEAVIVVNNIYSHTYYHWLLESLPRLFLVRDKIPDSVVLLPMDHNQSFHTESLEIFEVNNVQQMRVKTRYIIKEVVTCSQIGKIANYHPEILKGMVQFIKGKIRFHSNRGDKIYISRAMAKMRKVINEDEVESFLHSRGFITIHFEKLSLRDQVSLMHHCKYLIGIHGAGLANMIFMKEGTNIFELRMFDGGVNYFYFTLANTVNLNYYYQFCEPSLLDGTVQESDIIVDMKLFKSNVEKMLAE